MSRGRFTVTAGLVGAVAVGAVVTIAVRGGAPSPVATAGPLVATATVVRTDLTTTVLTQGTLGYAPSAPVVNRIAGTYTQLPPSGTGIQFGQILYRVDNLPTVLMKGATPAWRPFSPGMTAGPDVSELQAQLLSLGDASGLYSTPSGRYDWATAVAVERWQQANGLPATGQIPVGEIIFLPGPVLVGAMNTAPGQPAAPGDVPFAVTTTSRTVTVPLGPTVPDVATGEAVTIVLPTNSTTPGTITAVGPAPAVAGGPQAAQNGSAQSQPASSLATVTPDEPSATGTGAAVPVQVSLTTQSVGNVLAAPISALLALSGGGYGLEVVDGSGAHHLMAVTTGLFTGSQVQISGSGLVAGTKVVVAQ